MRTKTRPGNTKTNPPSATTTSPPPTATTTSPTPTVRHSPRTAAAQTPANAIALRYVSLRSRTDPHPPPLSLRFPNALPPLSPKTPPKKNQAESLKDISAGHRPVSLETSGAADEDKARKHKNQPAVRHHNIPAPLRPLQQSAHYSSPLKKSSREISK